MTPFPAAPLDAGTATVTVVGTAVCVVLGGVALFTADSIIELGVALLAFAIVFGTFGGAPAAFEIQAGRVRVRRRWLADRWYPLSGDIIRTKWQATRSLRTLGSGGMFGWYGRYWAPGVGHYRAYVTDRSKAVACTTGMGLVVVSPADPDAFIAAARSART